MPGNTDRDPEHAEDSPADHSSDRHRDCFAQPQLAMPKRPPPLCARVVGIGATALGSKAGHAVTLAPAECSPGGNLTGMEDVCRLDAE